jgi:hypothetical protein
MNKLPVTNNEANCGPENLPDQIQALAVLGRLVSWAGVWKKTDLDEAEYEPY